jgi:ABC-type lipoprotein release transport system permease subunit
MRALAEMRSRWRALLSAALLCGLFGAAVLALVAGARRTDGAYPHFLERQRAFDLWIIDSSFYADVFWKPDFDKLARLPYVETRARVELGGFDRENSNFPPDTLFLGSKDPSFGRSINKAFVVEGRLPNPERADEVAIPFFADGPLGKLHLGDHRTVKLNGKSEDVVVVGRTAMPGELPPRPQFGWQVLVSRAFVDRYFPQMPFKLPSMMIRFDHRSDVARFERDVRRLTGGKALAPQEQENHARAVEGSTDLQSSAFRLLAMFTALTGVMILGQLLARETTVGSEDTSTLSALGMGRSQLLRLGILRVAPVAIGGAIIAVVIAWIASTIFPRGSVRVIEPNRAPTFDGFVLGIGALVIATAVLLLVLFPAWRASVKAGRPVSAAGRPSTVASTLAATGMSVPAVAGARFALERGRGRTAVPVLSSLAIVALGIASFVAATTFSDSLAAMIDRPLLHGKVWDNVINTVQTFTLPPDQQRELARRTAEALVKDPDIEALATGDTGIPLRVFAPSGPARGIGVLGMAVGNLKGSLYAPIVQGRAPRAPDELVLGARMIRALGIHLDPTHSPTVELALQGNIENKVKMRVVGRGVIPPLGNFGELGYGVMLGPTDALKPLVVDTQTTPPVTDLLVRWREGVDPKAVIARHKRKFPELQIGEDVSGGKFADAVNFGGVQGAPIAVGGVLAALGAAALAHVVVTAIRRRRRDVAILKTVGFVRGQARRVVAWQATFTMLAATWVGIPLGVIGGRWLWNRVADGIGVLPRPEVGTGLLVLLVPIGVALANVIAAPPGRSAARTQPALVLRSE